MVQSGLVGREILAAASRDGIEFLAVAFRHRRVPEFFEHGQGGIDDAGAGAVSAGHAILDLLDDLVAMPRPLRNQRQRHKAKFAMVEDAAWSASVPVAATAAFVSEIAVHG